MADFGDEFIIESFRVPWLIWIQLVITILLILLLFFGFSIFTSDPTSAATAAYPSTASTAPTPTPHVHKPSSSRRRDNVVDQRVRRDEETIGELIVVEDQSEEGESSLKDSVFVRIFRFSNHPCNYLGQVKRAFLKCFGLDSSSEPSRRQENESNAHSR